MEMCWKDFVRECFFVVDFTRWCFLFRSPNLSYLLWHALWDITTDGSRDHGKVHQVERKPKLS